jgi:hypothetical protein
MKKEIRRSQNIYIGWGESRLTGMEDRISTGREVVGALSRMDIPFKQAHGGTWTNSRG